MMEEKFRVLRLVQQKQEEETAKTRYQTVSRKKLENMISRRIRTTMIGALAAIEDKFSFLWSGDGKQTKEQAHLENLFQEIRSKILDNGNDQIRGVEKDLEYFTVEMKKLHLEFRLEQEGK